MPPPNITSNAQGRTKHSRAVPEPAPGAGLCFPGPRMAASSSAPARAAVRGARNRAAISNWSSRDCISSPVRLVDAVAQVDVGLNAMQIKIHESQTSWTRDKVLAVVGAVTDALGFGTFKNTFADLWRYKPLIGGDQEATSAASWVADCEIRFSPGVRFHHSANGLDQGPGCEILSGSLFSLAGRLFQEAFKRCALYIYVQSRPLFLVDHVN